MRAARPASGADETELPAPQEERRINAVQESIPEIFPAVAFSFRIDQPTTGRLPRCLSHTVSFPHMISFCFSRFMNHRAPANGRYKPTCYEHAANCYTHAVGFSEIFEEEMVTGRQSEDKKYRRPIYSFSEEYLEQAYSVILDSFLIVPAIVGSALLHRLSDDCWEKITAWIYGMGLCALFIISTVFHIVSWKKSHLRTVEHCFHMCDRMVIYFFIAASYAPWLNLRELGPLASHMRWFIWLMAAGGTIYVFLYHEKYKVVELFFYLTMGFSPALVVTSMVRRGFLILVILLYFLVIH
ncbi:hypothetical protein MC885_018249 [Smutsia gigantea]|nr:hypothetical protein MC885_018249 [Smutsia gigantea]